MSNNLYCLPNSGERRAIGIVVELGFEDMVNVVGVGGMLLSRIWRWMFLVGAIYVIVTPWLDLGVEGGEDGEKDCEGEE
ncbi:hypothetical protein AHAS_Ahas13G0452800 [Arachis hypogaea]